MNYTIEARSDGITLLRLLSPHISLASVLVGLLLVSFYQYRMKRRKRLELLGNTQHKMRTTPRPSCKPSTSLNIRQATKEPEESSDTDNTQLYDEMTLVTPVPPPATQKRDRQKQCEACGCLFRTQNRKSQQCPRCVQSFQMEDERRNSLIPCSQCGKTSLDEDPSGLPCSGCLRNVRQPTEKREKAKRCPRCGCRHSQHEEDSRGMVKHCPQCHYNYLAENDKSRAPYLRSKSHPPLRSPQIPPRRTQSARPQSDAASRTKPSSTCSDSSMDDKGSNSSLPTPKRSSSSKKFRYRPQDLPASQLSSISKDTQRKAAAHLLAARALKTKSTYLDNVKDMTLVDCDSLPSSRHHLGTPSNSASMPSFADYRYT